MHYPAIKLLKGHDARLRRGHPWVYSNEIEMTAEAKSLAPGSLVTLSLANGEQAGTAMFNPHSLIAARLLTRRHDAPIDAGFFKERLERALRLREKVFDRPFYRLAHAEGDDLPGLVVDRYGDIIVIQVGTAGMERVLPEIQSVLEDVLKPRAIVLRNDSGVRQLEGMESYVLLASGACPDKVEVLENGCRFLVDPLKGQKTGWFFDQRNNRRDVAALARDARLLDAFCHAGGFAVTALASGARETLGIDSSADALVLAEQAANLNGVGPKATWRRSDVFEELAELARQSEAFDIVICDPPAFVKSRKDLESGAKGYRKLARLAAALVAPGGFVFVASCSHNIDRDRFEHEVAAGMAQTGRSGRIIAQGGAGPDHPIHPLLPETAYLKSVLMSLD